MAETGNWQYNKSGMRFAKVVLLIVSFMFAITAVLLIMIGSTVQALFYDLQQFIDDHFLTPASLLMAIGFILLFVATLGAYGAIKESCMLINIYGVCLLVIFILEMSAFIAGFVMKGQVNDMLRITMEQSMIDYKNNDYVRASVDFMQKGLDCCGIDGPDDWRKHMNQTQNDLPVPHSCCGMYFVYNDHKNNRCVNLYKEGCFESMEFLISQSVLLIAGTAGTVAIVQLMSAICAFMLAKTLRRQKSLREARRWQLQQSLDVLIAGGKTNGPVNSPDTGYAQLESEPISYTPNSPSVIN